MSLSRLPNELILIISGHIDDRAIANLLRVNRRLCFLLTPILHQRAMIPPGSGAMTQMQWASLRGHVPLVKLLLSKGQGLDSEGKVDPEALRGAIASGHDEISFILLQAGANVSKEGFRTGNLIYHLLNKGSYVANVKRILNMLRERGADFSAPDYLGKIPLHRAIQEGNVDRVELLLQLGADPNFPDQDGNTSLLWPCRKHQITRMLLEAGGNPNASNKRGETPVSRGCETYPGRSSLEAIEVLLAHGADPRGGDLLHLPLFAGINHPELTELLISYGEDINAPDLLGRSLIHMAALDPKLPFMQKLVDLGADVNLPDRHARATPLHYIASSQDNGQCTLLLIRAGAEIDPLDRNKSTPLHYAASEGAYLPAAVLLAMGADVTLSGDWRHLPPDRPLGLPWAGQRVVETMIRGSWKRRYGREMVPAWREEGAYHRHAYLAAFCYLPM